MAQAREAVAVAKNSRPKIPNANNPLKRALRAALRAPARSLASKIVSFVFLTALVASLAVTWVSAQSIQAFLREKIDQRLPAVLESVNERLASWYDQRELDVRTFASSATLRSNVDRIGNSERAIDETEQYLSYVLLRFDQYQSLFVLDPSSSAAPVVWVGDPLKLPDSIYSDLQSVTTARISGAFGVAGRRYQVVSSPIVDDSNRRLASLHAIIDPSRLRAEIQHEGLSPEGAVYVVSSAGVVLMQSDSDEDRTGYARQLPMRGALPAVEVYDIDGGSVVGSAVRFNRFAWTIAVEEPATQIFGPAVEIVRKVAVVNVGIVLVCSLIALGIARSVVRPIQGLSEAAARVANGEPDVSFPEQGSDEIGVLGRAFNEMIERLGHNRVELEKNRLEIEETNQKLISRNEELQGINEVFHQLSITDELTKLHNHRFFQDHLPREMSRAARTGEPLCLILIDIDDFKLLNDRHGHSVGDAVLKKTAAVMNGVVREMDLLARYGGEEFALLASQATLEGAVALAEKVRIEVSQTRFQVVTLEGASELSITVSIGVAEFNGDQKALFNDADRALYRAKGQGKDCVAVEDPPQPEPT